MVSATHDLVQVLMRNLSSWRTDVSGDVVFLDGRGTKIIPTRPPPGTSAGVSTPGRRRSPVTLLPSPLVVRWHRDSILAPGRNWFETVSQCAGTIIWRHE